MKSETTARLVEFRLGRAFLHLNCLVRGSKWSWHVRGIVRELFGRSQLLFLLVLTFGASFASLAATPAGHYAEPFRPQYHFTPEKNWMNDP
ncbi:MAG TPA: hypothetical protein VLT36_10110, partial [Candidatus Dormibacteraeota bacterium]|nr:hypothetical protein [Candidatus Dormibacteraeota bacterium]